MEHSEEFLRRLCQWQVVGDFYPFETGKMSEVIAYIRQIMGRLRNIRSIIVEPDFDSYGSGFASYVNVKISKKDKSDTRVTINGSKKIEWTGGISIYICKLAPFWYFGGNEWTVNFENDKRVGGSGGFLQPENIDDYDKKLWENDLQQIERLLAEFRYQLLTKPELEKALWFDVEIPTILGDKPYRVFDCFFYWED